MRDLALSLLRNASTTGEVSRADAAQLARGWLGAMGGEDAARVLDGGTFEAAALVRLCERILSLCAMLDAGATDTKAAAQ